MQMGTLGAGNHYAEIQVIDKVFDDAAARKMGIDQEGQVGTSSACSGACRVSLHCFRTMSFISAAPWQARAQISVRIAAVALASWLTARSHRRWVLQVCIMIHSGSRGLGHQVATDALTSMERAMARDNIQTNDRQLACARINSQVWWIPQLAPASCAVFTRIFLMHESYKLWHASNASCACCAGGEELLGCHVMCGQLCMGQSLLHDLPCAAGLPEDV